MAHQEKAKHVLRYLYGTADYAITYTKGKSELKAYIDSDQGGDSQSRRSCLEYIISEQTGQLEYPKTDMHSLIHYESRIYCVISSNQRNCVFENIVATYKTRKINSRIDKCIMRQSRYVKIVYTILRINTQIFFTKALENGETNILYVSTYEMTKADFDQSVTKDQAP